MPGHSGIRSVFDLLIRLALLILVATVVEAKASKDEKANYAPRQAIPVSCLNRTMYALFVDLLELLPFMVTLGNTSPILQANSNTFLSQHATKPAGPSNSYLALRKIPIAPSPPSPMNSSTSSSFTFTTTPLSHAGCPATLKRAAPLSSILKIPPQPTTTSPSSSPLPEHCNTAISTSIPA
ncbi:MAG: hypothetical protein Q9218_001017 [Villophora microphyllina]